MTAVEYAIAGVGQVHDHNKKLFSGDAVFSNMEGVMRDWVIETLYQGAYLREYHLWEKDCKEYFTAMMQRNGQGVSWPKHVGSAGFPAYAVGVAQSFGVTIEPPTLAGLETMRSKANVMKHEAGLTIDHFITDLDYKVGVEAIVHFWETLQEAEQVSYT